MESALDARNAQGPEWKEGEGPSAGEVEMKVQVGGVEWPKELESDWRGCLDISRRV